jgi:hypothetical protein
MIERVMQLLPGSKEEFVRFGRENQAAANKAVAKAFGGVEPSLAPQAMQAANQDLNSSYTNLLGNKLFKVSGQTANNLSTAFNKNEELRNFAVGSAKVSQFAKSLEAGQEIPAPLWKEVRSEIAGYVYNLEGAPKQVGKEVLKQFDDLARQNLGASDYKILQGIDKKYAALKSFEDAFARNPAILRAGDVDINKFAEQYAGVEPMNVLYGRTGGRGPGPGGRPASVRRAERRRFGCGRGLRSAALWPAQRKTLAPLSGGCSAGLRAPATGVGCSWPGSHPAG